MQAHIGATNHDAHKIAMIITYIDRQHNHYSQLEDVETSPVLFSGLYYSYLEAMTALIEYAKPGRPKEI